MSESFQLLNRISQNLSYGLFSLWLVKLFGASLFKYKYRTFLLLHFKNQKTIKREEKQKMNTILFLRIKVDPNKFYS